MGQAKSRGNLEQRIAEAQASKREKYENQTTIDVRLLSLTQRSSYLEMACKRGFELSKDALHNPREAVAVGAGWDTRRLFAANSPAIGKKSNAVDRPRPADHRPQGVMQSIPKSIPHGETVCTPFFELLKFVLEKDHCGGCHDTSAVLHMLLAEFGIESTLCIGEVGFGKQYFDHSWVEIDGQVFDVAVCMPLQEALAVGGPVFGNTDLSTGAVTSLQFGAESGQGLCDVAQWVADSDLSTYAENQPQPNLWTVAVAMQSRCGNGDATFKGFSDRYGQVRRKYRSCE